MPDIPQAPLALTAMTLRGVGSYLHGARLDVKPLTILCGTNGSGKSTWFKAINFLERWHATGAFPFPFFDSLDARNQTSACLRDHPYRSEWSADSALQMEDFGPPGTIGLHIVATRDVELEPIHVPEQIPLTSSPSLFQLLRDGQFSEGTRFRIRIPCAYSDTWGELIELCIDEGKQLQFYRLPDRCHYGIRISAEPTGLSEQPAVQMVPLPVLLRVTSLNTALLDQTPESEFDTKDRFRVHLGDRSAAYGKWMEAAEQIWIENYQDTTFSNEPILDFDLQLSNAQLRFSVLLPEDLSSYGQQAGALALVMAWIVRFGITRIHQLCGNILDSCFHVQALRQIHDYRDLLDKSVLAPPTADGFQYDHLGGRYVGPNGEGTLSVWRAFAYNAMMESVAPVNGQVLQFFSEEQIGDDLLEIGEMLSPHQNLKVSKRERRYLDLVDDSVREIAEQAVASTSDFESYFEDLCTSEVVEEEGFEGFDEDIERYKYLAPRREAIAILLNSLLEKRDLYRAEDWPLQSFDDHGQIRREMSDTIRKLFEFPTWSGPNPGEDFRTRLSNEAIQLSGIFTSTPDAGNVSQVEPVVKLLWRIIDDPPPHESPKHGTTSGWLLLFRWGVDHPPKDVRAEHLAKQLRAMIRRLIDGPPPGYEALTLIHRGINKLDIQDLRRLNRLLIESTFCDDDSLVSRFPGYVFDTHVSSWLRRLVHVDQFPIDASENVPRITMANLWNPESSQLPCGFLVDSKPRRTPYFHPLRWASLGYEPNFFRGAELECFTHPCFSPRLGGTAAPGQLSAGFHQIAPIIVQTSLMREHETFALENPEAHLHPSLQLKLTEFLIHQAKTGKQLIIETHSDLVVRRVLRSILSEEIAQSQVAIYFADIEKEEHGYHYSTLTPLQINDQGQIANWPKGFMDDDVKESRRLMDAMYGRNPEVEEDPES